MARKRIGEMLVEAGLLDANALRRALIEQRRWGGQLGSILIELKLVSEEALVRTLAKQMSFPVVNLDNYEVPEEVLALVPGELAERNSLIPFNLEGKFLDVAMSDPTNLGIIDELRIRTQLNVRTYLVGPKSLERALARFYGRSGLGIGLTFVSHRTPGANLDLGEDDGQEKLQVEHGIPVQMDERGAEIKALQARISNLEALVSRDEDVIRKLLGLLVDKGIASREEILERIK
jgi:hypothetical protein